MIGGISARLLDRHRDVLALFENHRFFREVGDGSLPPAVRDAYFRYERAFVERAAVILSLSLSKAPSLASRRHLHGMLGGLLFDQEEVFEGIFRDLGIGPATRLPPAVEAFCEGMTRIAAEGSYAEGIAAMLVAETTYARVARRFEAAPPADLHLRKWFALHATPEFGAGAAWLSDELDRCGAADDALGILDGAILRAARLEVDFHSAAWDG